MMIIMTTLFVTFFLVFFGWSFLSFIISESQEVRRENDKTAIYINMTDGETDGS